MNIWLLTGLCDGSVGNENSSISHPSSGDQENFMTVVCGGCFVFKGTWVALFLQCCLYFSSLELSGFLIPIASMII